jgi:tungstate transport system permease protein
MEIYLSAIADAFQLLTGGDPTVWPVIILSLEVSGSAMVIAALIGVPLGYALGLSRFAMRGVIILLVNTAMGFPPVVIGLFVYMALSRSGPLGALDLLFTPQHGDRTGHPGHPSRDRGHGGRHRRRAL